MIVNKNLSRNFIWNAIGNTCIAFSSFIILIVVTRVNGLIDAGIFSIAFATASILNICASYSGRNCQITDVKGNISDKEYIVWRCISSSVAILIMFIYILVTNYNADEIYILISLGLWKISEGFADVLYAVFQKKNMLYKAGISLTLKSVIGIVAFIVIDLITHNLNIAFTCLYMANFIIMAVYDIPQIKGMKIRTDKLRRNKIFEIFIKEFWLFGNAFLIMYILNAPKYTVDQYFEDDIQAILAIILIPASVIPLFSQFIIAPLVNKITNAYKEDNIKDVKTISNKIELSILGIGFIAVTLGALIGIPILEWIFKQDLSAYKMDFVIILLAYVFYGIAQSKIILLTMFRKLKEQFIVHVCSTILIVVISNLLINNMEILGVAFTYLITTVFYYMALSLITHFSFRKIEKQFVKK